MVFSDYTHLLFKYFLDKVKKEAIIRNGYKVPHLTRDTIMESDNNTRKHNTQESKEVSPFPAGDHKAALKEKTRQHNRDKKDPQKKHGPGMVSKKIEWLKHV